MFSITYLIGKCKRKREEKPKKYGFFTYYTKKSFVFSIILLFSYFVSLFAGVFPIWVHSKNRPVAPKPAPPIGSSLCSKAPTGCRGFWTFLLLCFFARVCVLKFLLVISSENFSF